MPHQCTECGEDFPDGSKEMLSGCPTCGGNTFQYLPPGAEVPDDPGDAPAPAGRSDGIRDRATSTVKEWVAERARGSALDPMAGEPPEAPPAPAESPSAEPPALAAAAEGESPEQHAARTDVVTPEEATADADEPVDAGAEPSDTVDTAAVPAAATDSGGTEEAIARGETTPEDAPEQPGAATASNDGSTAVDPAEDAPDDERPDLADLRAELNDQFESIRIVEPGEYELNLMQLYEREEHVIALREDGRYVIDIPDAHRGR